MRLEKEEREEPWERKQKQYEFEINQLEERAKLESTEMEKLWKDNEQLMGLREEERLRWEGKWSQKETETNRHAETTEIKCTDPREIEGGLIGPKDKHTHMELARLNGGELADWRTDAAAIRETRSIARRWARIRNNILKLTRLIIVTFRIKDMNTFFWFS